MAELDRSLPFEALAEQSIIVKLLMHPDMFPEVERKLLPSDFFIKKFEITFDAMRMVFMQLNVIDYASVMNQVKKSMNDIEFKNFTDELESFIKAFPDSNNMDDWVKLVRDSSMLRKIARVSSEIESSALERGADVNMVLDNAQQKIYELSNNRDSNEFITIHDALVQSFNHIELFKTNPAEASGIPTGFSSIDDVIVGLGKGDLVFLGARPGMGKTSLALNIAANVAKNTGKGVAIFSLEMSAEQLATRLLASEAMVDSYSLRSGKLTQNDETQIGYAAAQLSKTNIYIDDTSGISVMQMKSKLRRISNLGLVIVDYLQLVQGDKKTENRVTEVSDITRNMKIMAKDLGVPVICAAQLSRSNEKRGSDKKPMLSDLRESGSIEQDADIVMFLYSDKYYDKDKVDPDKANVVTLMIAKNRHGSMKNIDLAWSPQYTKFSSMATNISEND